MVEFDFPVGSIISIGDTAFKGNPPLSSGEITAINNQTVPFSITIDTTINNPPAPPVAGDFIAVLKNSVAESHGARGYYMEFTLSNSDTSEVELFSVGSNVMKSYP